VSLIVEITNRRRDSRPAHTFPARIGSCESHRPPEKPFLNKIAANTRECDFLSPVRGAIPRAGVSGLRAVME